jgi:thiosulfate/3-mercaptopyruvate sulfurtransferase
VPFTELLVGEQMSAEFKGVEDIEAAFSKRGVNIEKPIICTCGSGATAAILSMGLYTVSGKVAPVYDGSWMEWASVPGNPIVTDKSE